MHKTVSITIGGLLFHVEEQAYRRLDSYLQSVRAHFARIEDSDEIVGDIESRIAEHFSEKLGKSKQVINAKDVDELIATMGTVKDFEAFESAEADHQAEKETRSTEEEQFSARASRRLYRDPDDQVIAGVASGLAKYFGIDPAIVRIIFVVLIFAHGLGVLAYVILWIAVPAAKTPGQKLSMQGEPVTLRGFESQLHQTVRTFDLANFTEIYAGGAVKLRVRHGKEREVIARGNPKDLQRLELHVEGDALRIERRGMGWITSFLYGYDAMTIDIVLPALDRCEIEGASRATIEGFSSKSLRLSCEGASRLTFDGDAQEVDANVEGASQLSMRGKGRTLTLRASGASTAHAAAFAARTVDVEIDGACSAYVAAEDALSGHVGGASSLQYAGTPTVTATAGGASSIGGAAKKTAWPAHDDRRRDRGDRGGIIRAFTSVVMIPFTVLATVVRALAPLAAFLIGFAVMLVSVAGLFGLIFFTITMLMSGGTAYVDASLPDVLGSTLYALFLACGFVLAAVPLGLLLILGKTIALRRNGFTATGALGMIGLWLVALMTAAVTATVNAGEIEARVDALMQEHSAQAERTFPLGDFSRVSLGGAFAVNVRPGKTFSVVARGAERDVQRLDLSVADGALQGDMRPRTAFCVACGFDRVMLDVTMPALDELELAGASTATITAFAQDAMTLKALGASRIEATIDVKTLDIAAEGASRVRVNGEGTDLRATLTGASHIDAQEFAAQNASVHAQGASRATINASRRIDGDAVGSASVRYVDHPSLAAAVRTEGASIAQPLAGSAPQ